MPGSSSGAGDCRDEGGVVRAERERRTPEEMMDPVHEGEKTAGEYIMETYDSEWNETLAKAIFKTIATSSAPSV